MSKSSFSVVLILLCVIASTHSKIIYKIDKIIEPKEPSGCLSFIIFFYNPKFYEDERVFTLIDILMTQNGKLASAYELSGRAPFEDFEYFDTLGITANLTMKLKGAETIWIQAVPQDEDPECR